MLEKRKRLLFIYGIFIFILLIVIMFLLPDRFFLDKYKDLEMPTTSLEKKEFIDYSEQKKKLLNKNFSYEYILLDSMGSQTYTYECNGVLEGERESGICTLPENFSYNEKTKKEDFKYINQDYLSVNYIFHLLEGLEEKEVKYTTLREYHYQVRIEELDTEIVVYTNLDNINKIEISNAYMTYVFKYENIR